MRPATASFSALRAARLRESSAVSSASSELRSGFAGAARPTWLRIADCWFSPIFFQDFTGREFCHPVREGRFVTLLGRIQPLPENFSELYALRSWPDRMSPAAAARSEWPPTWASESARIRETLSVPSHTFHSSARPDCAGR